MLKGKRVSIVIPTLDEGKNIAKVIKGVNEVLEGIDHEILIVDGMSTDSTVSIAKRLGARVIFDSVGKGHALREGLAKAHGDILVSMDADLSNEPKELRLLIDSIDIGYDICMGSRFITGGGTEDMPAIRKFGNKLFVTLVNLIFGSHYSDMCYGYRSFRKSAFKKLDLKENGFGIETEININAAKKRLKVIEIPSNEKKRVAGEAKLRTFKDGATILKTIIKNVG
jgi:glycosyltransferase involved in cell wall biosynthesis